MKNVKDMSGPELVAAYNKLTGKSVKKFSTKAIGIKSVEKAMAAMEEIAVKATAKKAPAKVRANGAADHDRAETMVDMLRKGEHTVAQFMTKFDTNYKNITGSLYFIRKGVGVELHKGEELLRRREGMVCYYSLGKKPRE